MVVKWGHKNSTYDKDQLVYRVIDTKDNDREVFSNFEDPMDISYGIEFTACRSLNIMDIRFRHM
ncbi:MAG: hypothetical protein ACLRMZ_00510 [Blautia marasmi]